MQVSSCSPAPRSISSLTKCFRGECSPPDTSYGSASLSLCKGGSLLPWSSAGTANSSWDQAQQVDLSRRKASHKTTEKGEWKKGVVKGGGRFVTPWSPCLLGQEWGHTSVNHCHPASLSAHKKRGLYSLCIWLIGRTRKTKS